MEMKQETSAKPETHAIVRRGRGFAGMDPARQREIARAGGRAAHLQGVAHEFTSEEAALAGRKGGEAVSRDRLHMAEIGAEGGRARSQHERLRATQASANLEPSLTQVQI